MTFYSANHVGIWDLSSDDIQRIIPDNHQPFYYLSKEEIGLALTNKDCVGIRVYKMGSDEDNRSISGLLVCGVLEDGFDAPEKNIAFLTSKKDTIFQLAEKISVAQGENTFTPEVARGFQRHQVENILNKEISLSAYFSLAMLNRLLDMSQVTGILLYEADLTPIQERVPNLSVPASRKLASYVAFVARSTGSSEVSIPNFNFLSPLRYVLSDQPCPGHCLQINPKGVVSAGEMVDIQSRLDDHPYPLPWDNENHA